MALPKVTDRLNPKCPKGPWSNMEEWGQGSWFRPSVTREEEKRNAPRNHYPDNDFDSPDIVADRSNGIAA